MRAIRSRLSSPAVSGVSGQHSTTMSASATSSSTLTKRTSSGRLFGLRLLAITSRPKPARAVAITALPTLPAPTTPSVRPCSSCVCSAWSRPASQPFWRRSRSIMRKRRSSAMVTKNTCSATERALTPGTLATSTPALVAASIGIMSRPAPCLIAARSLFGAASNRAAGSGARTMTMSASRPSLRQRRGVERRGDPELAGRRQHLRRASVQAVGRIDDQAPAVRLSQASAREPGMPGSPIRPFQ